MLIDVRRAVEAGLARVEPGFAGREARARLGAVPDLLGPAFDHAVLERTLGGGDDRVDLSLRLAQGASQRRLAARLPPSPGRPGLDALLQAWSRPGNPLHAAFAEIWLEHDLPPGPPPEPFVHLGPGQRVRPGSGDLLRLARRAFDLLGSPLERSAGQALDRIDRQLPPGGSIFLVALANHRAERLLRLSVALPGAALSGWLERIGWGGDRRAVTRLLARLGGPHPRQLVQLDLGPDPRPWLGLEFCWRGRADEVAAARRVLDALVDCGACGDHERGWLERWPTPTAGLPPGPAGLRFQRLLDVKVLAGAGAPRAKAYLAFEPRPLLQSSTASSQAADAASRATSAT